MRKAIIQPLQMRVALQFKKLSLRQQLAIFISSLVLLLCMAMMMYINIMSMIMRPFNLQTASMLSLGVGTILGGLGSYWLAGKALQPVREISRAARFISASTLHTRLQWTGPKDELGELTEVFNQMLNRLERSFEQQSQFVADAAHELRTPLTNLRTNLELVLNDPNATLADYQNSAAVLERALTRLERLTKDLLVLSSPEQPTFHEQVTLLPLLEDVMDNLAATAQTHKLNLHLELDAASDPDVTVWGSSNLLGRVFTNLVENAIYYNRPGGQVSLRIIQKVNKIWVEVCDSGIGIEQAEQGRIFERFYRVDRSRSRHKGGAGLGLAIVKHLVQQHKGRIEVESSVGQGTTFRVELPLIKTAFVPGVE